jgi:hypothetical protein
VVSPIWLSILLGSTNFLDKNTGLFVYKLKNDKIAGVLKIALGPHMDEISAKKITDTIGLTALSAGFIVVVTKKQNCDVMTCWDSKYGTLQFQKNLREELTPDSKREYSISRGKSSVHGDVLLISYTTLNKKNSFATQFSIVPYFATKLNLLSSIGKLPVVEPVFDSENFKGQLSSIIPVAPPISERHKPMRMWKSKVTEWNTIDQEFIEKLLDPTLLDVPTFQQTFIEWIFTKQSSLRNWNVKKMPKIAKSTVVGTSETLFPLPSAAFSQKAMSLLIEKCFADKQKFWPRAVVEYLLETGNVSTEMVPGGIMAPLTEMKDLSLINRAFNQVLDLTELDYCKVVQFTTTMDDENSGEIVSLFEIWQNRKEVRRIELLKLKVERIALSNERIKKRNLTNPKDQQEKLKEIEENPIPFRTPSKRFIENMPKATPSPLGISVNEGQKGFLQRCFSSPHIQSVLAKELVQLSIPQLHVVFEWLRGVIAPEFDTDLTNQAANQKFPLWWLWYDNPMHREYQSSLDKEFRKYETVYLF